MSLIFRERLPPSTHLFPYRGSAAFLETYIREVHRFCRDQTVPDFVVFTDLDEKQFDKDFRNSLDKIILHSISTYDPTQRVLVAKMTSATHADLQEIFGVRLVRALRPEKLDETLALYANRLFEGQGRSTKADKAWGPLGRTLYQGQRWPTVVMEVAVSETRTKLLDDISFWLTRAFGQVQMVIAAEVARTRHQRIQLEKWVLDENGQPHCAQQVTLRKTNLQNWTPIIENGPLVIEFESLFLRAPRPGEADLVLDDTHLGIIAKHLWAASEEG